MRVTGLGDAVRIGNLYGPDATFLGVPAADPDVVAQWSSSSAAIIGAPFDGGTSHRAGCRFGPQAIRVTDYLPHNGKRPSLSLGVDALKDLAVVDLGDVEMPSGDTEKSLRLLEERVAAVAAAGVIPIVLGGDHTIALSDVTGVARHVGWGRVSVIHFDAHADTGDTQMGSLYGHGTPMRRLIESGACRGDRFLQIGLRGYWPEPATLDWMAEQGMRSFEMSEVVSRGMDDVLDEAIALAMTDCDAVFLSIDVDVVDPGVAPRHRHARTGWPYESSTARCRAPHRDGDDDRRCGRRRGLAALRPRRDHGLSRQPRGARSVGGHRLASTSPSAAR